MNTITNPWNVGQPGGMNGPFYSVVKPNGNLVALQIPDEITAKLIARIPVMQAEIKRWQERAGSFATLANFAALTALEDDLSENDIDQLNEIIDTVRPFLVFDEEE